jgi:hypothetical protein
VEVTRYVLVNQKLDKATSQIVNYVAQEQAPENPAFDFAALDTTFETLLKPYPFDTARGGYAVTGIAQEQAGENQPVLVQFQHRYGDISCDFGGAGSGVGSEALNGLHLDQRDFVIVTEAQYRHESMIENVEFISEALNFDGVVRKKMFQRYRFDAQRQTPEHSPRDMNTVRDCCGYYCDPLRLNGLRGDELPRGNDDLKCGCYPDEDILDDVEDVDEGDGNTCADLPKDKYPQCKKITCGACGLPKCLCEKEIFPDPVTGKPVMCACSDSLGCPAAHPNCHDECPFCTKKCGCDGSKPCRPDRPNCTETCSTGGGSSSSSGGSSSSSSSGGDGPGSL